MIRTYGPKHGNPLPNAIQINTTSGGADWEKELSPFYLGPCYHTDGRKVLRFENLWQFSKIYSDQVDENGNPNKDWETWSSKGFSEFRGVRYPKGKGAKPLYTWWNGKKLNYIEARKTVYIPEYSKLVVKTAAFQKLKKLHEEGNDLALFDFDGYPFQDNGMTYTDAIHNTSRPLGHSIVIMALLENVDLTKL